MRKAIALAAVAWLASAALADPWFARGDFNGWGTGNQMTWDGSRYVANVDISTQTPGNYFEFKIANEDWSLNYPPDNHKTKYPALADMDFYFYPGAASDGWMPANDRVGYEASGTGWEVMGAMNGWSAPFPMSDLGNGHYQTVIEIASPGTYEFKFRGTGDWEISVGQHFGRFAPNASFTAGSRPLYYQFDLDLQGGRWLVSEVPEPAGLALALVALLIRRR